MTESSKDNWLLRLHKEWTEREHPFRDFRASSYFIIPAVSLGVFTDVLFYGVIVPVFPISLEQRAGIPHRQVQTWVSILLAVYGAAMVAFSPVFGIISDMGGSRKLPYVVGSVAGVASVFIFWFVNSPALLSIARLLQGLAAACVWVVGLTIICESVDKKAIGTAMSAVVISLNLGNILGPLIGGTVFDLLGYDAVFVAATIFVVLDLVVRLLLVEQSAAGRGKQKKNKQKLQADDADEPLLGSDADSGDGYGSLNNSNGHANGHANGTNGNGHLPADAATPSKMSKLPVSIRLLLNPQMLTAMLGILVMSHLFASFDSILPFQVIETFHWRSFGAGATFLPIAASCFGAPLVDKALVRYGSRAVTLFGFLFAVPFYGLMLIELGNTIGGKILFLSNLFFLGCAITIQVTALMAEISKIVDRKEEEEGENAFGGKSALAQAYALFNVAYACGILTGPLISGALFQNIGWAKTNAIMGAICAVTAIPVAIWTDNSTPQPIAL